MDKIRFIHIPKTAGSTFRLVFLNQYRNLPFFKFTGDEIRDKERFEALSDKRKNEINIFFGHSRLNSCVPEANDAKVILFLRDPISRVKSFCQHVSEGKSQYLLRDFPPSSFDLDQFLKSGNGELSNLQSRILINQNDFSSSFIDGLPHSEAKELAFEVLAEKIEALGLTEYFDESLINIAHNLHWKDHYYFNRNKKNKSKLLEFNESHLEQIQELNRLDIEVYNEARQKFFEHLKMIPNFSERLVKFKENQKSKALSTGIKQIFQFGYLVAKNPRSITPS